MEKDAQLEKGISQLEKEANKPLNPIDKSHYTRHSFERRRPHSFRSAAECICEIHLCSSDS